LILDCFNVVLFVFCLHISSWLDYLLFFVVITNDFCVLYVKQHLALGIKLAHNLSGNLAVANIGDIGQKYISIPHKCGFAAMPLLHRR